MKENQTNSKSCSVCGSVDGETFVHPYDRKMKNVSIQSHHIIPQLWTIFSEFKNLTVPLCKRCHDCCAPNIIASYNHALSHRVARVLNNIFPMLEFRIKIHDCGNPKCSLKGKFYMDIDKKIETETKEE